MQLESRVAPSELTFKIWSSVVMLNSKNFDQFIQGHEISRTLYKVVLFVQLGEPALKSGVSQFHYLAHNFTHRFALNSSFRILFGIYPIDNGSYPSSLPTSTKRTSVAKLLVMKSLADEMLEFGGELDTYNFRNNCSLFISECIKSFQRKNSGLHNRQVIKWRSDSWYKCIGINEVAFYTDRPADYQAIQEQKEAAGAGEQPLAEQLLGFR
uniref:PPPDE domain-containing protein n=1 Tax=Macrostomum lignano TaxID=282301 RepID=A0A1I8GAA1_9PLAT